MAKFARSPKSNGWPERAGESRSETKSSPEFSDKHPPSGQKQNAARHRPRYSSRYKCNFKEAPLTVATQPGTSFLPLPASTRRRLESLAEWAKPSLIPAAIAGCVIFTASMLYERQNEGAHHKELQSQVSG